MKRNILLSLAILAGNLFLGVAAPITGDLQDESAYLDGFWRAAQGQHVGIDYHDPIGFGPPSIGGALWHLFGPHYFVFRLTASLIALLIILCGCYSARKRMLKYDRFATLFCLTLAFVVSAPNTFGGPTYDIGMSEYYNRLSVSALLVLFLTSFESRAEIRDWFSAGEIFVTALLLNILFAVKISGFAIGIMIALGGCLAAGRPGRRVVGLASAIVLAFVLLQLELWASGLNLGALLHEYALTANARLRYAPVTLIHSVLNWPTIGGLTLLLSYAVSKVENRSRGMRRTVMIIATYAVAQVALNLTNSQYPMLTLGLAAALALGSQLPSQADSSGSRIAPWWSRFGEKLANMPVREAIPYLLFGLVLVPEVAASGAASIAASSVALGFRAPLVVTAGYGFDFRTAQIGEPVPGARDVAIHYSASLMDGVRAIKALHSERERIATLDFANPFPLLFQSPSPRGIHSWWALGFDVSPGTDLSPSDVLGDATLVLVPLQPEGPEPAAFLTAAANPELLHSFDLVYRDQWWALYRRKTTH